MELLTNSSRAVYQACPRKFYYMYELCIRPKKDSEALVFGKLIHKCLEIVMGGGSIEEVATVIGKLGVDDFEKVKAYELMRGYVSRWKAQNVIGVEQEYKLPLVNPNSSGMSKTFELAGKIDAIFKLEDGRSAVVEHKSTSENIEDPGAPYWQRLAIDPQITGYMLGCKSIGISPDLIIYDVISKPGIKPLKATPKEQRKYTKQGALYANQRDTDESPEEFRKRLREDIESSPDSYFQRREVYRLEEDVVEYCNDMWSVAKLILESRSENFWPRRVNECFSYGKCPYYCVCSKMASLDDAELFVKIETKNPELENLG